MFVRGKLHRLTRHEYIPELAIIASVVIIIHLCNSYYEYTGNQYILIDANDNDRANDFCPLYPSTLHGAKTKIIMSESIEWTDIPNVQMGGSYSPHDCKPREELAIIIPFRNREYHLKLLLKYLHPFLQRQKRAYQIFVVEQTGNVTFNKGIIMNIAFRQALETRSIFRCFIFHDVDLLPENDYNIYECDPKAPRHFSPAVDELRYVLMYNHLVGGVLALSKEQFLKVNGWSNLYWGWGAEDDDMAERIRNSSYRLSRPPNHIGRYKMIRHEKREPAVKRYQLLDNWRRYLRDGVAQVDLINYTINSIHKEKLLFLVNMTSSIDLDDDLISFTPDDLECRSPAMSDDSSTRNDWSIDVLSSNEPMHEKMSDITDLLALPDLHDNPELVSTNIMNHLSTHNLQNDPDHCERYQRESDEKCLNYGSKQLSPNDYMTRTSLYNRPVAFEKDSRSWARCLLDNFKKTTPDFSSTSSSTNFPSYFPIVKKSSSFDHHVQYIEHLNECNDYPAYLEYLRENRSQLFCTLTDSIDVIDGLLGTVVSSF